MNPGPAGQGLQAPATALGLGEAAVAAAGTELVTYGLGSCIGLVVWSARLRVGALCHIVLPDSAGLNPDPRVPARYADWAVAWSVAALESRGARRTELVAKLAGGAQVLNVPMVKHMGRQNTEATQARLQAAGIRLGGTDVGGTEGRTVRFFPDTGILEVRSLSGTSLKL